MSGLGLSGLMSGMDTDALIETILQYESQKVTSQQIKKAQVEATQQAWGQVRSSLSTLRSKLGTLQLSSTFAARTATLSNPEIASVTVTAGSTLATHTLTVRQLAQYHSLASRTVDDPNAALGQAGTLSFTVGETTVAVTLTENDTLNSLRDLINEQLGEHVKAEVTRVPVGAEIKYRLVLTAKTQGLAGAIDLGDYSADPEYQSLLSSLGLITETEPGEYRLNELSVAQDAAFTLNGIDYTSSSNTVSNLLPGVTITLKRGGASDNTTSITIDQDADKTVKAVEEWVKAVNDAIDLLKDATQYNSETGDRGLLAGEPLARTLLTNLRAMISETAAGLPAELNRLSQVGITTGAYGTADFGRLVLDKEKLKEVVLANEEGVAKLFGAVDNNVALKAAGSTIAATSTADGVFSAADLINGDTDSARFGSMGGGWQSAAAPTADDPQYVTITLSGEQPIESVLLFQPDSEAYPARDSGLKEFAVEYWDKVKGEWVELKKVTNHSGPSARVEFDPVTTSQIRVKITGTYGEDNPARLTEIQVIGRNTGPVAGMNRYLRSAFETQTGALDARDAALKSLISDYSKKIDRLKESLSRREELLRAQFSRMERAMAELQRQSGYIQLISQMLTSQSSQNRK